MRRIARTGLAVVFVSLVMAVSGTIQATHAAMGGLTISPTSIDVEVAPGESYTGKMTVLNQSDLNIGYATYVTPYSVSGEEYKPHFTPVEGATDATRWFKLGKAESALKVGEKEIVPFTITVPKGTGGGSYFATVFAETKDKKNEGVVTRKRVGMVVYLRVSGDALEKGSMKEWNVPFLQEAPLTATVKITNEGSVHFPATIRVVVRDIFGNKKFDYERKPKVLPQKIRSVPVVWENGAALGIFKVGGEISYLDKTEKLPEKYVFVANTPMRLLIIGTLLVFAVGLVIALAGRKRAQSKE